MFSGEREREEEEGGGSAAGKYFWRKAKRTHWSYPRPPLVRATLRSVGRRVFSEGWTAPPLGGGGFGEGWRAALRGRRRRVRGSAVASGCRRTSASSSASISARTRACAGSSVASNREGSAAASVAVALRISAWSRDARRAPKGANRAARAAGAPARSANAARARARVRAGIVRARGVPRGRRSEATRERGIRVSLRAATSRRRPAWRARYARR